MKLKNGYGGEVVKRIILLLLLALTMVISVTAGTLATYTVGLDNIAEGSVVAKEFIFLSEGTDSFQEGLKIAPGETHHWQFKVKNYDKHIVSETDMYYKLNFKVFATPGKQAIAPLVVTVKDSEGNILKQVTGSGTFAVQGAFPLASAGQERDFTVEITWPHSQNDRKYAGQNYGTSIIVDAQASQLPFPDDSEIDQPEQKELLVVYETTVPWQNGEKGEFQYEYRFTITNQSDKAIEDWYVELLLQNEVFNRVWNAKLISPSQSGVYRIENPAYNNKNTDNILPGQRITFGGLASGKGEEVPQIIGIGGSNTDFITKVSLICRQGLEKIGDKE